jgi:sodium/potassium-transporting ATPase subunit alpha
MVVVSVLQNEKDYATIVRASEDDSDLPLTVAAKRRIRYFDDDAELGQAGGPSGAPGLKRRDSTFSIHSLSSMRSGQRFVDPAIVLPVQYRTLSYSISQHKDDVVAKGKNAREKTVQGREIVI